MSSAMDTQFSHTEEYEVGPGTMDLGRLYEYKMVALMSLRCILQEFEDVKIAFNAADLGALDDVIISARRKEGDHIKILFQLKHEEKGKNLSRDTFLTAKKGNFSLLKYCGDILKLKDRLDCKLTQTGSIINDLGTFDNIYFILFTNKGTDKQAFLDNDGCDAISFLNTNADNDNLYKFDLTKVSELSSLPQIDYNFYLFAKQSHVDGLEEIIESEMEKVFQHFGLTHSGIKNYNNIRIVSNAFVEYVTDWSMGKLGGHHYLTKHAILYKLTELLLKRFELDLSREKIEFYDCPQKELWNEVVNDKRITIVDSDEEVIKFLKLYVGKEIRPYYQELGKTWSSKFLKKEQEWFLEKYDNLKKSLLKIVGRNRKITLLSIYKCLWFNECLPLLLKINTLDEYEIILKILKLSEFKLKIIVLTSVKLQPTGIELDYFATLFDLNKEKRLKILNNFVKLQGRSPVTLKELIDDSLFPLINCNAIINILMGNFNIGIPYEPPLEYFIHRSLLKVFLQMDVLKKRLNETFVIKIKEEGDDETIRSKLEEFQSNPNVIIIDEHNPIQIEKLKLKKKPIHRLVFDHNNLLEWKESFGSPTSIKRYQVKHRNNFGEYLRAVKCSLLDASRLCNEVGDVLANGNADNYFNNLNLISASPGMGKTTLLNHIASVASTDMWVLNINLSDHDDYYDANRFKKEQLTVQDQLKYFNDLILENCNCSNIQLAQSVFQNFVNRKRVLVLLDAMDEVSIYCENEVVEMINSIHKAGFSLWLTTRPHMATELERKFATISTTLRPFTIDDQKRFLNKYFKHIGDTNKVATNQTLMAEFVDKLLQACRTNLNDKDGEFTGIPLQTKLLANAFSDQLKESFRNGIIKFDVRFDLFSLYEEFMKRKDNITRDKFGKGAKDMRILFQNHQQLFALNLIFDARYLFRLGLKTKLYDYYNNNEEHIKFLQQDGVTVIQRNVNKEQKFRVQFVHRTFAEYFVACWLFNNFNGRCDDSKLTAKLLLKKRCRMNRKFDLLFRMFDCMVARESQLHMSIINGRLDQALELIKLNPDVRDMGGRTFLHIIALYAIDNRDNFISNLSLLKNEMTEFVEQIPAHYIKNIRDFWGCTPLDYALSNSSFTVANILCENSKELTISTDMLNLRSIYNENRWLINPMYKPLFKTILPILICQQLVSDFINHDTSIISYAVKLFGKVNDKAIEIINEGINDLDVTTISDLLIKMNIKSADTAQDYYYDLGFAVTFGSILNVQDLILSEYWSEQNNFYTPLIREDRDDRLEIVKLLIFYGENINKTYIGSRTSLHCAAQNGHIEIVRELLSHEADVNLQADDGDTPLCLAIRFEHIETAKLLLAHNARVDIKDSMNTFPLHYYPGQGGLDDLIPDLISEGVDVNYRVPLFGNSLLAIAVRRKQVNTVRVLLRYGGDCNIPDMFNNFLIHNVAEEGLDEVLPEIINKTLGGVNVLTKEGQTALHLSIYGKRLGVFKQQDSLSNHDSTNRTNFVKFLVIAGANPNIQDNKGNTALHYLCKQFPFNNHDRKIVAGLLIDKRGDVNLKNNDGNTPLLYLLQNLQKQENPRYLFEIFPFLIHEDSVNVQDTNGNTALHYLFEISTLSDDCRKNGARLVLDKCADVNIKNNNDESSLHFYVRYLFTHDFIGKLFEIFPLVVRKANVNLQDSDGNTALHYCCRTNRFQRFDKQIMNLLLEKGADLNLKNKEGETPLDLAHRCNLTDTVSLLQQYKQLDLAQSSFD